MMKEAKKDLDIVVVAPNLGCFGRLTDDCFAKLMRDKQIHKAHKMIAEASRDGDFRALEQFLETQGCDPVDFNLQNIADHVEEHGVLPVGALLCRLQECVQ